MMPGRTLQDDDRTNDTSNGASRRPVGGRIILAVMALAALTLWWFWADQAATNIARKVRFLLVPGVVIVLFSVLGAAAAASVLAAASKRPIRARRQARRGGAPGGQDEVVRLWPVAGLLSALTIITGVLGFLFLHRYDYEVRHDLVRGAVTVTKGDEPGHEPRLAYPQARERILFGLGDYRGDYSDPTYVVGEKFSAWCSFLSVDQWRRPLQGVACLRNGEDQVRIGRFEGQVPSPNAWFRLKLSRRVAALARGTSYADADVYGFLDENDRPTLVVPVHRATNGVVHSFDVPAGAVVWGPDGKGRWLRNPDPRAIPGPAVGLSRAEDVRRSIGARGSWHQWRQHRLDFEDTSSGATDANGVVLDSNVGNTSELTLARVTTEGQWAEGSDLVTPLTPYGKSTNIVAVAVVDAAPAGYGKVPRIVVHQLPVPRQTNTAVVATIASRYGNAIPFANTNQPDASATRPRVMEITPGPTPKRWQVTIGLPAETLYRIEVDPEGGTCVFSNSGRPLRCDPAKSPPVPASALTEAPAPPTSPGPVAPVDDLVSAPLEQLIAQRNRLQAEIDRRAGGR